MEGKLGGKVFCNRVLPVVFHSRGSCFQPREAGECTFFCKKGSISCFSSNGSWKVHVCFLGRRALSFVFHSRGSCFHSREVGWVGVT
jgi:hypothetical protein